MLLKEGFFPMLLKEGFFPLRASPSSMLLKEGFYPLMPLITGSRVRRPISLYSVCDFQTPPSCSVPLRFIVEGPHCCVGTTAQQLVPANPRRYCNTIYQVVSLSVYTARLLHVEVNIVDVALKLYDDQEIWLGGSVIRYDEDTCYEVFPGACRVTLEGFRAPWVPQLAHVVLDGAWPS